ncbi:MAG TPA: PsiF family protein [Steroidobacteraceae bacterium]
MGAAFAVMAAQIAVAQSQQNSQQAKMTSCNADAEAKGLKGEDRKAFVKSCLSDKAAAGAPSDATSAPAAATAGGTTIGNSQQEKMRSCNADAKSKGLKGADRKAFMKDCLSASPAAH